MAHNTSLNSFVGRGTTAARIAFTPDPPTPSSGPSPGYLWWDTDLQAEYAYDFLSVAWVAIGPTAGSGTVTHTGSLTANRMLKGNGTADLTVGDLTGDVTTSATMATTIANDAVSNAKLANMATATFKGRTTAGTGDPEDLTATQATALLNNFVGDSGSGGTKGHVPAPAAGDAAAAKFLKADGSWATPAGSGNVATAVTMTSGRLAIGAGSSSVAVGDLSGDITTSGTTATTLAASGAAAGTYRRARITVNAKGLITSISNGPASGTVASSATPSINTDNVDIFTITALAANITSMTSGLSGTPVNGQSLVVRILDNGTARSITWGASFVSRGATLPTTTVLSKYLYVGVVWNSTASKWDCVAVSQEA